MDAGHARRLAPLPQAFKDTDGWLSPRPKLLRGLAPRENRTVKKSVTVGAGFLPVRGTLIVDIPPLPAIG
jgi:hypothetical protein